MACSAGTLARCSQMPVYRPLMGRFLYSTRVSLLELLHTRHRTCPVMAMGANSKPVRCCLAKQQGPDLSLLSPRLRQEWDYDKNQHLNSARIKPHSTKVCAWICPEGTADDPHHWHAQVNTRTTGHGCPYCAGAKVSKGNSLATLAPDVAKSWCYKKNKGTPHDYTSGSSYKATWDCTECGNQWSTTIQSRVRKGSGCLKCFRNRLGRRKDGSRHKHPTFAECNHALLSEWDHDKNAEQGLLPEDITLRSHKPVHWVCRQCSLSILHKWVAQPNTRIGSQSKCPYCSGQAVCRCNSLATCCEELAQEWDYSKNKAGPGEYTAHSNAVVWWQTASRGSWQQSINQRMRRWPEQQQRISRKQGLDTTV
ncbi:TPA: hypothetical protein ACH3X1_014552 [Trebouxia sp. C0004]